ncbi:SH3 domain-binding protein 1-like [Dermacentor silvarum]|uniref:SH3 domain-binding protein 1-like n=1 Tax=Dermacentor silvarum TaxID=543639 RepID=UPI0021007B9D|nr:SH3 domain-binding protein 1-like [Dermacentor silvarum]
MGAAQELLEVLYVHGPESVHVFGVRPLVSDCVELKSKLECGETIQWHAYSIYVHAAVFLNFLQCLPTPLLGHDFYDDWMDVAASKNTLETKAKLMRTSRCLPECHQELLRQWLLVLRKVCRAVPRSHTTPALAGHFVGPSMLWRPGASFVEHPANGEHAALATVVRCLVLFLDDVWNNVDEKGPKVVQRLISNPAQQPDALPMDHPVSQAIFMARKRSTREAVVDARPDAFTMCTASQFVDSLERESRRQAELHDMIMADSPASSPKPPQVNALHRCSRSVHTWPGRVRRNAASLPSPPGSGAVSKVATFPRCSHLDLDDAETGFSSLHDEDYLYPDWAFQYPEWHLCGEELPTWASRSCFTMDLNSLHDQTTRKWITINTALYNRTLNLPMPEAPPAHDTLSGMRF